MAATMY